MDLLDIVSTLLEISQNRESYGEEIQALQETLQIIQRNLKKIGPDKFTILSTQYIQCPKRVIIKHEIRDREEYRIDIKYPKESRNVQIISSISIQRINTLTSKLPGSTLSQLKERKDKLVHFSSLLSHILIADMVPYRMQTNHHQQHQLQATMVEPNVLPTQADPNVLILNQDDDRPLVQLILRVENNIKQFFVKNSINIKEICHCVNFILSLKLLQEFPPDTDSSVLFKFQRQYYSRMEKDIVQINQISREHAFITCVRERNSRSLNFYHQPIQETIRKKSEDFIKPNPKIILPQKQPDNENFFSLSEDQFQSFEKKEEQSNSRKSDKSQNQIEDVFSTCEEIDHAVYEKLKQNNEKEEYSYKFILQNLGQMGTHVYQQPAEENKTPTKNQNNGKQSEGVWYRLKKDESTVIRDGDKIAILMCQPEYKIPLISYQFNVIQKM